MDLNNKKNIYTLVGIITFTLILYTVLKNYVQALALIRSFLSLLFPFILGACIAFILNVPMKAIEKRLFKKNKKLQRFRRATAYLLTLFLVILVIFVAIFLIVPELVNTVGMIVNSTPGMLQAITDWTNNLELPWPQVNEMLQQINLDWDNLIKKAMDFLQYTAQGLLNSTVNMVTVVINSVINFFVGFVFSIYILFQKEKLSVQIKKTMRAFLPKGWTERILEVLALTSKTFESFLSGQCLEAVILGCMFFVAMFIFQLPYSVLISVLIALLALIPMFGAFIGCALGVFLILFVNPLQAVVFLIMFLVIQQIEGNLIYPHVVGNSVGLPSMWVLVAVTLGANLMGVAGMLIFIPLTSVIYALLRTAVNQRTVKAEVNQGLQQDVTTPGETMKKEEDNESKDVL